MDVLTVGSAVGWADDVSKYYVVCPIDIKKRNRILYAAVIYEILFLLYQEAAGLISIIRSLK